MDSAHPVSSPRPSEVSISPPHADLGQMDLANSPCSQQLPSVPVALIETAVHTIPSELIHTGLYTSHFPPQVALECGDISDNGPVTETSRVEIGALSQPLEPDFVIKDRQHTSKAEDNTSESYDTTQSEFEGSPEDLSDIPKVKPDYDWTSSKPKLFVRVEDEFKRYATKLPLGSNYLRGCLWSPDGTCLLTNSCDNVFRVFEFPPALTPNPMDYDLELNLMEPDTLVSLISLPPPLSSEILKSYFSLPVIYSFFCY
uniref:Uncharacterized protein n=1 Tax=Schistocephalus solidus TaxID=70667 RepID=A0A0V0JBZ5_SCHSO